MPDTSTRRAEVSEMPDEQMPSPILDTDKRDRLRKVFLQQLAKGDDPVFAEMAREVQSGRMTLREAVLSSAYRDAFTSVADKITESLNAISEEEMAAADGEAVDEYLARHEHDERETDSADEAPAPDSDDVFSAPIMQAPPSRRHRQGDPPPERSSWQRRRREG
ncbi:hypothetical protein [Amycolatopsis sp. NPDC049868]|uniref:hypothetical protein n=1 Tax=Amycolatopsis sp. NPDC049868 TaxID=3363934 RepID=UPI0037984A34